MKRCPECNNLVEDRLKACNYCGYPFTGEEAKVVENQAEKTKVSLEEENQKDEAETISNNSESNIENQTSNIGNDTATMVSDKITEDIYPIISPIPITARAAQHRSQASTPEEIRSVTSIVSTIRRETSW